MNPEDKLTAQQLLYLDWLLDERPTTGELILVGDTIYISPDSPSKGTKTAFAQRLGMVIQNLNAWGRSDKFQSAFRNRIAAEVTDPTYFLDVIRNVREIASGRGSGREDPLKAADLYARLTGYTPPAAPEIIADAKTLSTAELERITTAART